MQSINIFGIEYPVVDEIEVNEKMVPIVDIRMMSDIKWKRMALEDRLKNREVYEKYCDDDVDAEISRLERWLEENDPEYRIWRKVLDGKTC